ncbi:hypothetical protein ACFFQF_31460 [Haladaptatus pallidirubidus]|uniref:Uncharacterized protein n=1 Tax=Haladaptatus pallidirubidus TaxID=1008152 RepID=A0AAV3UPR9_9EURY|nr:hypothetical protein [Haladaptatus pallidirubidus]
MAPPLTDNETDQLLRTCRTVIGDELRSVTYFSPNDYQHLYLREDLERGTHPHSFVENERGGFSSQRTYEWSELGDYRYTMRTFDNGYLVRVIVGTHGTYVTTDSITMDRFNDVAEAVSSVLEEIASQSERHVG